MVQRRSTETKWWDRLKEPVVCYSIFVSFVAILSNITQLKNFVDFAFAIPNVTVQVTESPAVVAAGDADKVTITANNHTQNACEIKVAVPAISPENGLSVTEKEISVTCPLGQVPRSYIM
jgi:hypothetical protein